jgi:ligand-binding sensor domain-containing protein
MIKHRVLFFLFLFSVSALLSQKSGYINYGLSDGLPQSQVRAISQDDFGYLWIGTMAGLSRFDGVEFKNFSKRDGLADNQINCFYRGSELFVGTTGALCFIRGREIICHSFPEGYRASRILDFAEGKDGILYLATAGEGVLTWNGSDFNTLSGNEQLPDQYVRSIAFDGNEKLWIGTRSGLVVKEPSGKIAPPDEMDLQNLSVSQIRLTSQDRLIITTFGNGVFFVTDDEIVNYTTSDGLISNFIRCVEVLSTGQYFFGSKSGLSKYENGTIESYDESKGLSYSNVKSLGKDREGNLWIGTDGQGLLRSAGEVFTTFSIDNGLNSNLVMSIAKGSADELILGTYDAGISILNGDTAHTYPFNDRLPSFTVWSLTKNGDELWAGTSSGLFVEKNGDIKILSESEGLPGNRVTAIFKKSEDEVIIGTENGFAVVNSDVELLKKSSDIKMGAVRAISDWNDQIILGTDRGPMIWNGKEARIIPNSIEAGVSVYCLDGDQYDNLWIGTSDGLYVYSAGADSLQEVLFAESFGSKNVNFLISFDRDRILIGTNNGMYTLNTNTFQENGRIDTKHYTQFEGLFGTETNQNAVFKYNDAIWFGTTKGVIRFDFRKEQKHFISPSVKIADIQLFLENVDWKSLADSFSTELGLPVNPELKYGQNYLTFNYNGIYFSNPDKIRYRYKVEGVDENWLGPTKSRSATYAYLPHGDFTFRVQSYQVDNPELVAEASFPFSVKPPFYLTPWFFLLMAGISVGMVYLIYSSRLKKEREKRERLQLALQAKLIQLESQSLNSSMNRHFIFNALNSIQYYINMQDRKSANRYLTSFAKLIRKNLDSSQQMDTSLNEELERLKLYLSLEQMRFQDKFNYRIDVDEQIDTEALTLPAMMLQPFLENSIWHGILPNERQGEISIEIKSVDKNYEIIIDDNGVGIETSLQNKPIAKEPHVSHGMDITLNRIRLYQNMTGLKYEVVGPFERKSNSGKAEGTRVIIRIPKKSTVTELNGVKTWKFEAENVL